MITFIPYRPEHLARVEFQPAQRKWADMFLKPEYAASLDVADKAWTGVDDAGRVIGCAGFAPQWEGRVIGWAVFGRVPRIAWRAIVRKIRAEVDLELAQQEHDHGHGRVEITVPHGFGAGCKLAKKLGFVIEGSMAKYGPDGAGHFGYARTV